MRLDFQRRLALTVLWALPFASRAQFDRPIRLIVGFTAGGTADQYARLLAPRLAEFLERSVVVENKPGAGATLAAEFVARSNPDGSVLLMGATSEIAALPVIREGTLKYRVPDDFSFVGMVAEAPVGIMVAGDSKLNSLNDLIQAANTRDVSIAYAGAGGPSQLAMELVKARLGIRLLDVAYQGTSNALPDLMSGRVDGYSGNFAAFKTLIDAGKLKVIVLASAERNPAFPNVKTFREQGVDIVQSGFFGILAPAATPEKTLRLLSTYLSSALKDPAFARAVKDSGAMVRDYPLEKFREYVNAEMRWYRDGLKALPGIQKLLQQ